MAKTDEIVIVFRQDADTVGGKRAADFALLNGNSKQTFKVADAVEDDDAVNRRQLLEVEEACGDSDKMLTSRTNKIEKSLIDLKETVKSVTDDNAVNRKQLLEIKEAYETSDAILAARINKIEKILIDLTKGL